MTQDSFNRKRASGNPFVSISKLKPKLLNNKPNFYTFYTSSSSLSCRAASTDIPDPLSPLFPVVHRLWQVFRATSRILT